MRDEKFAGTAWHYARFRPQYSEKLLERVIDDFGLDGAGRLLDLGYGTGHLAIPLSRHFREVIGLDPEPEMLAEGLRQSEELGIENIRWLEGGSFDLAELKGELGNFDLVTMGNSFHWMDRDSTLEILAEMVNPGGGIAVMRAPSAADIWEGTEPWQVVVKATLQKWLGSERRAGTNSTYSHPAERHEAVIARSAFSDMKAVEIGAERQMSVDEIVGGLYSTSFASEAVLGENRPGFEADLRAALFEICPDGQFMSKERHEGIFAWLRLARYDRRLSY